MRIAKALNVSPMWLLLGDKSDESLFSEEHPVIGSDYYPVPRYEVTFDPKTDTEPKLLNTNMTDCPSSISLILRNMGSEVAPFVKVLR